jgi:hypothetical protein
VAILRLLGRHFGGLALGLTDAALDRRAAALDSDDQAAAALRKALERIRAEERGYRELGELGENR